MAEPPIPTGSASAEEPTRGGLGDTEPRTTITDRELFERLAWFTHVRWVFGAFCLLVLLFGWYALGVRLSTRNGPMTMAPAVEVVLLLFLYNAVFTFLGRIVRARERITRRLTEYLALGQIVCDLVAISLLIYYTGGVENFFVILLLVPIVIVTELLPQALAYATAAVAAGIFNFLAWGEQQGILPHVAVRLTGRDEAALLPLYSDPLYVLHVTAAVTVTIFAMVFVASTIASRLRSREAELEQAYHRLAAADEAKGFFMRKAEHEMRAPLAAIHSILNAVTETSQGLTDPQRRLLERAKHRAKAMMSLVNDLLKFSRLRSPEETLIAGRVRVDEIVANTVELLRKRAEDAELILNCQTARLWAKADQEMLVELVTNLVANAIQYTPRGGRIEVALKRDGGWGELTVADTGIGISAQARRHLFEEFYRAPEGKEFFADGTGLGLAIVKRIVQIHRGTVEAEPRAEGGTVFRVRLPLH